MTALGQEAKHSVVVLHQLIERIFNQPSGEDDTFDLLPLTIYGEFTNYANFATAAALSVVMGAVAWLGLMLARALTHAGGEQPS